MKTRNIIYMTMAVFFLLAVGIADAQQALLPGASIPKFVEALPVAGDITVVDATNAACRGRLDQILDKHRFLAKLIDRYPDLHSLLKKFYVKYLIKRYPDLAECLYKKYHPQSNTATIAAEEFRSQILPTPANWTGAPPDANWTGGAPPDTCGADTASYVWGYLTPDDDKNEVRPSFLGPVVVAERGVPFYPEYLNNLPVGGNVQMNLPIDMTLDWANPFGIDCQIDPVTGAYGNFACGAMPAYSNAIPIATHLHGGEVAPAYDGGPDAWFTPGNAQIGIGFPGSVYEYLNEQQESTIWFHDHALGITRLNVYAGLAGVYPIIDPANPPLATMPAFPAYDIPLIIQDRSFDTNCEIFYNLASNPQPNMSVHPFWIPEFIGDTIVVNGKTWPYLKVEQRQYRFRLVNGSNARFYDLTLDSGAPLIVIATDDGYLVDAVSTPNVIIGPGERYEIIVDFEGHSVGDEVIMKNAAETPFPIGIALPTVGGTDSVMQFKVIAATSADIPKIVGGTPIRPTPMVPIVTAHDPVTGSITRQLTLNEVSSDIPLNDDIGGPLELVLNNSKFNKLGILAGSTTPLGRETELPAVGDTEIWELINISADAHPMHLHLTSFQVLDRTPFDYAKYIMQYNLERTTNGVLDGEGPPNQYNLMNADGAIGGNPAINFYLDLGGRMGPLPYEMGWKDTVIAYPGEVTRIAVRWDTTDTPVTVGPAAVGTSSYPFDPTVLSGGVGYVWHCHIIDHEDNEMMRNYVVGTARQLVPNFVPPKPPEPPKPPWCRKHHRRHHHKSWWSK